MPEEIEGYVTVNEAARKMGRSTEQVRRYLREGRLAGKRIGGQWFIRETALLYRTRSEEIDEMTRRDAGVTGDLPGMPNLPGVPNRARVEVFERINRRREDIRRRWETLGISVDAAELVRSIREEEP